MNDPLTIQVEIIRMTPAVAEVILRADVAGELRGRLMGPRCPQATTVEIAYPLRDLGRGKHECSAKVVIPEPNFWEPDSPFVYGGPVELWQDGKKISEQWVEVGLRRSG